MGGLLRVGEFRKQGETEVHREGDTAERQTGMKDPDVAEVMEDIPSPPETVDNHVLKLPLYASRT